ncbi:MAG TPA: hypothetical protein VMT54_20455 [Candidatus Cybelea sp.]|nr:hypothetical protein [Candidatus Cybelea sp.]
MAQDKNASERALSEAKSLTPANSVGNTTPLVRGDGQLPQARERHTIIEKKVVTADGDSEASRHLLSVTAAVNAYAIERGSLILAIYGSQPGEGASMVARELAISLSRSPTNSVLLIDGSIGATDQGKHFGSTMVDSLWSAARGAPIRTVRLALPRGGSVDLAALKIDGASDPSEIDLRLLPQLFNRLRNVFNVIIIDCPPVLSGAGYVSASSLADSCLLVVEAGRTRIPVVQRAMEEIEAAGGKLQGVVLNRRKHYIPSWLYRRL